VFRDPDSGQDHCGASDQVPAQPLIDHRDSEEDGHDWGEVVGHRRRRRAFVLDQAVVQHVPDAEQGISYGMPAFRLRGKTVAGFAAFKHHLSYLPHSESVIPQLAKELEGYTSTSGSLHFPVDQPLPEALVRKLLAVRMAEAFGGR
jgi:uncharacterized protein YdhG (YjbR/CyaY superfamily)